MWTRALLVGMVAVVGLARAAYPSTDQYATPRNHHRAAADAPLDKQTPSDKWSGFDAAPDDQDASYELGFGIIDENDNLLEAKNSSARRKDDDLFFAYVVEPTLLAANSEGNSPKKRSSSSTSENDEPEAVMSLPELLRLWGLDTAKEVATKRVQRGDIEVTERPVARGDVPLAESQPAALSRRSKRDSGRKLLWASGKDKTRSFGEDDVLLKGGQPSGESIKDDADQQTKRPEHHENKDLPREDPEEEEKKRRQEEEERRLVELGHRQEEEERRLVELGHRQEEEERRLVELGLRKKEEESRLVELELRKKEEESRLVELELRKKEEVRRKEEVVRTQEEEVRRKEEEVRRKEEEVLRQEEEARRQAEEVLRQEEEVRRQEEEKRRQEQQRKGAEDELVKPDDTDNVKMHHKKADDDQRVQEREVATKRVKLGDIKVTERRVDRSDVPLAKSQPAALSRSKRNSGRKLLWANDKDRMWGFSEDDGLLQGDQPSGESSRDDVYQQTTRPEHHRKHHQNRYENEGRPREDEEEEEKRRRQMEAGRRQEEEGRRQEEERRRQEEERRRQEEDRRRQDQQRKGIGNELRKPDDEYDARMQEWYRKKAEHDRLVQEREEARKRPSQPHSSDELERERKLQDYIRRNTPIRPGQPASSLTDPRRLPYDRKREEECCRRLQEERDNRNNEQVRKAELERRRHEQERRREEQRRRQDDELAQRPTSPQGDNRRRHEASKTRPPVDDTSTEQMRRHDSKRPRPDTKTDGKDGPRPGGSESRMNGNRWRDEENRRRYLEFKRKESSSSSSARQPAQPTKADVDESRKLQGLPVDARIIIRRPEDEANATAAAPLISLRAGGPDEEIDFPGFSPGRRGPQAQHFPAPVTKRPPAKSPAPCVWALVVCCNQQHNDPRRQMRCFEGAACLSWDADRCRKDNVNAANDELLKFYVGQAARTRPKNTIILS